MKITLRETKTLPLSQIEIDDKPVGEPVKVQEGKIILRWLPTAWDEIITFLGGVKALEKMEWESRNK